jgi:hypothetical protein
MDSMQPSHSLAQRVLKILDSHAVSDNQTGRAGCQACFKVGVLKASIRF